MAIRLKDLVAGQQRLQQQEEAPVRLNPDQFKGLVEALSGAATSAGTKSSSKIFEEFVAQTAKREELLKDATEEQKAIFNELEGTLKKLQTANHADSISLRRSIEALNRRLAATPNTAAKTRMTNMMPPPPSVSTKNTFAPTLTPENYAISENSATVGNAEVKTESSGGGLGSAIAGIGSAVLAIGNVIAASIKTLGDIVKAFMDRLFLSKIIDRIPPGSPIPDIPGGPGMPDEKGPKPKTPWWRNPKNLTKIGKGAAIAGLVSLASDPLRDLAEDKGFTKTSKGIDVVGTTTGYASAGSLAGGLIGGGLGFLAGGVGAAPGAVIGSAIGGIAGGGYGLYKGIKKNFVDSLENKSAFSGDAAFEFKKGGYDPLAAMQAENNTLKLDDRGRPITVVTPQMQNPMGGQDTPAIFAPGPSVRPNENTFTRYMDRIFGQ